MDALFDPDGQGITAAAPIGVQLLRPRSLTSVAVGEQVSGIGWVSCESAVAVVEILLGHDGGSLSSLGHARIGLSRSDLRMLVGQTPAGTGPGTGFVFHFTVPNQPAGAAIMRLRVRTHAGDHQHDLRLNVGAMPGAFAPTPSLEPAGELLPGETTPPRVSVIAARNPPTPKQEAPEPVRAIIEKAIIDEHGILRVAGWAAALTKLERLDVFLGARLIGAAEIGIARVDLTATLPEYPNAAHSGFILQQEVGETDLAATEARIVAGLRGGTFRSFTAPLDRAEQIAPQPPEVVANLVCEEVLLTGSGRLAVKGWAVASSGVAEVRVELDEHLIGTLLPDEIRPDVGNFYPRIAGARSAGFRLVRQLNAKYEGEHIVRLSVRGRDGEENACFQPVTVTPGEASPEELPPPPIDADAIKFFIDTPACKDGMAIETVRGFLSINGWAIGRDGIDRIEIFVDGVSQGRAHHGIRREDLQAAFPDYDAMLAGFAMMLPPQVMKKGLRSVRIDICDKAGRIKEISFSVQAEAAATGPGPWMLRTKLPQAETDLMRAMLRAQGTGPRWTAPHWTVLLAADDSAPATLDALALTAESLRWQACDDWSLTILADSAESAVRIMALLDATQPDLQGRIRVLPPSSDGPRPLGNLANGFLVLLAPGDRLGEDALLELSIEVARTPATDFVYSDERRVDPSDGEEKAFFKPDFSPDLLLSTNYVGRLWAATPALLARAGLTEADLRERGDYDAVLRLTEQSAKVGHVAKVLCARARRAEARGQERAALLRAMRRRRIRGKLLPGPVAGTWRMKRDIVPAAQAELVSIIIPTIASRGYIKAAIDSIRTNTAWPNYEIVCLDNIPRDGTEEQRRWKAWIAEHADRTVEIAEKFNWSRFNNRGARAARGAFLLFLNDDIEVKDPRWLHGLVEHAQRPEVGVVGPQLLYPDGRVQHAGMFLARRAARHAFRFYPHDEPGPFGLALTQRNVISVTGACMMMRREVFDAQGGFDEAHAVVNNDLDFNLRLHAAGLLVVYTPAVSLIHHEMVSRAELADTFDSKRFARDWSDLFLRGDPYFNRHFSPDCDDYLPDAEPVRLFTAGRPLIARNRVRRILAIKVDHIGDFVTAFPAFRRLKERFPDAELTVLAAKASLALAAMEPAIDHVVEFNFFHARSEKGRRAQVKQELAALHETLGPRRFDLAIDLRRQPDTRPILQSSGARWLAGFEHRYEYPWLDITVEFEGDNALHLKHDHISDSLVALVDAVSVQCETDRKIIRNPIGQAEARAELARLLSDIENAKSGGPIELPPDRPIICVHAGAGALNKQWPPSHFAGLIDLLVGTTNAKIIIIGGPDEALVANNVLRLLRRRSAVTNLVGRTGLRDLPAVLRAADLYVGNDSGPKHLAAALGVPTVGVHSGSVDAGEWGAVGPHALTIRRDMNCSPCYLARAADCHRALACLDGIRVGDVFAACMRMLPLSQRLREARASADNGAVLEHAAE